jgi:hypothetical protein
MDIASWVLILTLSNAGTVIGGKAIHSVPNFTAEASCNSAGETWVTGLPKLDRRFSSYVCVATK